MSKEPLGPAVRHGDDQWLDIVKWVAFGLSQAEEFGITSANLGEFTSSPLNLERGVNTLWTQGGLLYSPPFR
jgi:general L-amino acid transport system substrate-binding protein